jgi:hypothetical protein
MNASGRHARNVLTGAPSRHLHRGQAAQPNTHPFGLGGLPSLCEDFASRLELAAVVDMTPEVRAALATLGEWMRTGEFRTLEVAHWLVGSFCFRDAR